jgi:ATP-binding cassette subfamily B protein
MSQAPLIRLMSYSRAYRTRIGWATAYSILNKLFDLAPPALIGIAIDTVVNQENAFLARFGLENPMSQLYVLAVVTLVIWIGESVFEYANRIYWRNLAQDIEHQLRMDAYTHVQALDMSYFEDSSTGELMSILNDDINQLERFLDVGADNILQILTAVILVCALFVVTVPGQVWMTLLPIPFIIGGSVWFQRMLTPRYADVRERVSLLNSQLSNNLSGIATVKSFTSESHEANRISSLSMDYNNANRRAIVLSSAFSPLIRMLIVAGFIAIMVFAGQLAFTGQLNVGLYSVTIFMTQRLLWPLTRLGEVFDQYQRAMASTNRVMDLLNTPVQMKNGTEPLPIQQVRGEIEFEDVRFAYQAGDEVLKGLSLHVPAGTSAAIVGMTGAGKSTIAKLLLRFYDVTAGRITLDNTDLRDLDLHNLRSAIGLVSQDVYMFHGTVRENIAYGTFDATDEQIIEAAKIAEAHEFIMALPQGYNTIIGERGQKLSGGQRQRVSIARTVLNNPPILILDEATAAVDNETEAAIQRSLEKIIVGRTTIMIAHRLSTVRNADTIFVMENGTLREHGKHEELVQQGGVYASLWEAMV